MVPLISVIIPTANRPQYLPRAVASAMAGMAPGEVEVIVVPNGPDESWQESLKCYARNQSIRVVRIVQANANIARNAGLAEAKGAFVRFLDDDDYLVPEGVQKQYELIQASGVDVVSGSIQLVDKNGLCFDIWNQPDIDDLCTAVVGPWRNCLPHAHIYKRSRLKKAQWNPKTRVRQDMEWLFDLCAAKELSWAKTDQIVGVWQHHWEKRISSSEDFNSIRKLTVSMLIRTYEKLQKNGRLNGPRQHAVAAGLWGCIQGAFFLEPGYWSRIARTAQRIDCTARPVQTLYHLPVVRRLNPLWIQWVMLPKRWSFHHCRQLLKKLQFRHSW